MFSRRVVLIVCTLLIACLSAVHGQIPIEASRTFDGTFIITKTGQLFHLSFTTANVPIVVHVPNVVLQDQLIPNPNPNPNPGTPTLEGHVKNMTLTVLQNGGSKTTGAGISSVFSLAANSLTDGNLSPEKAIDSVKAGIDMVLRVQGDTDKWTNWKTSVSDALVQLQNEAKLKTKEQYASTFRQIAAGMNAATGFNGNTINPQAVSAQGIFGDLDIFRLIELIKAIRELFNLFSGKQELPVAPLVKEPVAREAVTQPNPTVRKQPETPTPKE